MPESRSLSLAEDRAYDLIEQAIMESARGRRFLAEFVRRHRSADTTMLLDAMGRLEQAVVREHVPSKAHGGRDTLVDRRSEPVRTRAAETTTSVADRPSKFTAVSEVGPTVHAPAARQVAADLLNEAETLQETAWRLRESGAAADLCSELDQSATRIYAVGSSQDALRQHVERAVETFHRLQVQTSALEKQIERAGQAASRRDGADDRHPTSDGERLRDLASRFRQDPAGLDAVAAPSFDDLDRLSIEERLALFS